MRRRGESKAPAQSTTSPPSIRAVAPPPAGDVSTPETVPRESASSLRTTVSEMTVRFGRSETGATNAWNELFRRPSLIVERFQPEPASEPESKNGLCGNPASSAGRQQHFRQRIAAPDEVRH